MSWDNVHTISPRAPHEAWEGRLLQLSNAAYHQRPELSSSDIKHMLLSPAHFRRGCLEKHLNTRESNEAFALGDAMHAAFLEQRLDGFVVSPRFDRRTKQGKADAEAFDLANAGRTVLLRDQFDHLKGMFDVVASSHLASALVSDAMVEESYLYMDEATGLRCKFRPDAWSFKGLTKDTPELELPKGESYIADFKTAVGASPHEFAKSCARYHYHLSAAHYLIGVERIFGEMPKHYILIVQEKTPPYALAFYRMSSSDIQRSLELRASVMKKIAHCAKLNHYPDFSERALTLSLPGYAFEFKEHQ